MTENPEAQTDRSPSEHPPRRRIVQNTLFSLASKAQGAVLNYLTTLILLRALSVESYGLYSLLFVGVTYNLGLLTRLGIPNVLTRFIPEYFSQSNYRVIGKLFNAANLVQAAVAALLLAVVFIFASPITSLLNFSGTETVLRIFAVGAFAYLLSENFRLLMGGVFLQRVILLVNTIYNLARLCTLFFAVQLDNPLMAVVAAEVALFGLLLLTYWIAYRRTVRTRIVEAERDLPDKPVPWRRFSRYAGLYYLNEVGVTLLNQATDLFLISSLVGDVAVGLYGLANRVLRIAFGVLPNKILGDVIEPAFYSEYGSSTSQTARFGFNLFLKVSLLASLPIGLWIALMSRPLIIQLFDPRYADAAAILAVSGLFLPVIALRMPLGVMLQHAERPDLLIWAKIAGVFKIILGLWLVREGGVMMMVWITCLTTVLEILMMAVFIAWKLKVHADYLGILKLLVSAAISVALFFPLSPYLQSRIGVLASIPLFAVIFLGVNMLNRAFRKPERDFINKKLPYPLWKF
jgi:O-antigen/teichoic acid export membrane protein